MIDSSGIDKKIPIVVNITDIPNSSGTQTNNSYSIKSVNKIKIYVE